MKFETPRWVLETAKVAAVAAGITGCHPPLTSPDAKKNPQESFEYSTVEAKKNTYQEPTLSFEHGPTTPEAAPYKSVLFKYLTSNPEYAQVQSGSLPYISAVEPNTQEDILRNDSLALIAAEVAHQLYPQFSFMRTGTPKGSNYAWQFQTKLADIQKLLAVPDSQEMLNEQTLKALDTAWQAKEQEFLALENEWKQECERYNLASLIDDTTGNQLLDRYITLFERASSAKSLRLLPNHLKKFMAGEGNIFLTKNTDYLMFQGEKEAVKSILHEHGHNVILYGLPGKSEKIDNAFSGAATSMQEGGKASQLPFLYAVYGGKKIPKDFIDQDGNLSEYEGPAGEYYRISWNNIMNSKVEAINKEHPPINVDPVKVLPLGFVSGYGAKNALEDFAEMYSYTLTEPEQVKAWVAQYGGDLQKKYDFIQNRVLNAEEFQKESGFKE